MTVISFGNKYPAPLDPPHGGGLSSSASSSKLAREEEGAELNHGHLPSFRVIGVQISHLSRTGQFVFCTLGVFFFLLIYGFLQVCFFLVYICFCSHRNYIKEMIKSEKLIIHLLPTQSQEYMVIHVFKRKLGIFLTLCQFTGYSTLAALHRVIHDDVPRRIPLGYYVLLATLQVTMDALSEESCWPCNSHFAFAFTSFRPCRQQCKA